MGIKIKELEFNVQQTVQVQSFEPIKFGAGVKVEIEYSEDKELGKEMLLAASWAKKALKKNLEDMSDTDMQAFCTGLNKKCKTLWKEAMTKGVSDDTNKGS